MIKATRIRSRPFAARLLYLMSRILRLEFAWHVRRLSIGYKRTETRGISVATFDSPSEAYEFMKKEVTNADQEGIYYILAETRFASTFVKAKAEAGAGEATPGVGPGVHSAAEAEIEPGRLFENRREGEALSHAGAGEGDRERD